MSHFTVMVFGDNVESLLEPYDENMNIPKYSKGVVSEKEKEEFSKYYIESEPALKNLTFDQLYKLKGNDWNDNSWEKDENGLYIEYSTYNPNSKWDWYSIGGRWSGFFKLKEGKKGEIGEPGFLSNPVEEGYADSTIKSNIDVEGMRNSIESYYRKKWKFVNKYIKGLTLEKTWESLLEKSNKEESYSLDDARKEYYNQPIIIAFGEAMKEDQKTENRLLDLFSDVKEYVCTEEEYAQLGRDSALTPYAYLNENGWFQRGEMGWWGIARDEQTISYWNKYFNEMFDKLPDDTKITLVDCHI